jgi:tetratricopeptide (TPR) repeat protein
MNTHFFAISALSALVLCIGVVVLHLVLKNRRILKLNSIGLRYKDFEMWDQAIICFQKALDLEPQHAVTRYNLGFVLYFGKRLHAAAFREFTAAIAFDDGLAAAHYALGHLLFHELGKPEEARKHLLQALKISPGLAEADNTLALIEIGTGNWAEALACFRRAVKANPQYEPAYCNLAVACLYQGHNAEAVSYAQGYVANQPNSALAHRNLGSIYGATGQPAEAEKELEIALSLDDSDWIVHFWLGCLRLKLREPHKAVASFREALERKGAFALVYYNLALCYEQLGLKDAAKTHIERAIELNPALGKGFV